MHVLADVLVEVGVAHPSVVVAVRLPRTQSVDHRAGEPGRLGLELAEVAALPGVLGAVRRGEDRPAVTVQRVLEVHAGVALGPGQKGAAVAAVQQQDDGQGPAAAHLRVQEGGLDGGGTEQVPVRVAGREVQVAVVVLDAVAGDVQQQDVASAAVAEEPLDGPLHLVVPGVHHGLDPEVPDARVRQHLGQPLHVPSGRAQASQVGAVVLARGNQQGVAVAGHDGGLRRPRRWVPGRGRWVRGPGGRCRSVSVGPRWRPPGPPVGPRRSRC